MRKLANIIGGEISLVTYSLWRTALGVGAALAALLVLVLALVAVASYVVLLVKWPIATIVISWGALAYWDAREG